MKAKTYPRACVHRLPLVGAHQRDWRVVLRRSPDSFGITFGQYGTHAEAVAAASDVVGRLRRG